MTPVKFFAYLIDKVGCMETELDIEGCKTVGEVRARIKKAFPKIAPDLKTCMIAINMNFETDDTPLHQVKEIAVIPPVSGG